jgi:hypothetical protein
MEGSLVAGYEDNLSLVVAVKERMVEGEVTRSGLMMIFIPPGGAKPIGH